MAIVLALLSAVAYGVSDYIGGRASRRVAPVSVALSAELVMAVMAVAIVPIVEPDGPTLRSVVAGVAAGVAGSVAIIGLYRALSAGNMTVVAPITGVVAAAVPVLVGVGLGERPGPWAWAGIALAIVAVALIGGISGLVGGARRAPAPAATIALAVMVGVGFGLLFVALARTGDSGLWPLLFARCGGLPVLIGASLVTSRERLHARRDVIVPGLAVGVLIGFANATYLIATRHGLLSVVAVVVSMYPASTIALATVLDGERAIRSQAVGMALAAVALVMITVAA